MAAPTVIHDPSGDIDLTIYTEEERVAIVSVMERAKSFQKQEENKFRQPMEGQLMKWTNYMKGWQYRWFTLDPDAGIFDYYVDKEKMKQGPRGSVNLAGASVCPSDEDSFTFSVNAINGDVFKLRANNAKERQHWINTLRSVAEFHTQNMAPIVPQSVTLSPSLGSIQSSQPSQPSDSSSAITEPVSEASEETENSTQSFFKRGHKPFSHVPANINSDLAGIREILHCIEDDQITMIDQLELEPLAEESIYPLDEDVLLLKATAQSTLSSLHHCFSILQRRVAEVQSEEMPQGGGVTLEWLEPSESSPTPKPAPSKPSPDMRHLRSLRTPGTPKNQAKQPERSGADDATENPSVSCCEQALISMDKNAGVLCRNGEVTDEVVYSSGEEPEHQSVEEHKSVILHLLSQLKLGMDLTKVVLPTFILEPRSLLEMYADFFAHPDMFIRIADGLTAEDRILAVLEFYLTSFHVGRKGSLAKKPYNPILGETFTCSWDVREECSTGMERNPLNLANDVSVMEDDRGLRFVAEQISHHPPVSGFYAECPRKKICLNAHIWTKSKFYGMSIGVANVGEAVITLLEHEEEYHFTFPSAFCRSILTFPWVELGGKLHITCPKTGYNASVTFHTKPFYGGKLHRVTGEVKNASTGKVICKVAGEWNGKIEFNYTSNQEQAKVIDTKTLKVYHKRVRPVLSQEDNESRRLWHTVTSGLRSKNTVSATEAKHALEEKQRKEARERAETGAEWKPRMFHRHNEGWRFNQHLSRRQSESDTKEAAAS
ncbi:oxysterol-binding protein-related protein 11 isoform X2 [Nematostella vectensis]|uniref:oxysterol-binding protein-related protein 11 isoform X2 n=1 Tax=Nematostella vectensis TaxID=45351 RepID=UPI0020772D2C|nr:oxysterol-binding protein-related protein 11 isoform X2 [Nematostella vectensis]